MPKPHYQIAIALVHRDDRWLVARRPPTAHLGGLWEFPGGKQQPDEAPAQTALRELREECGVEAFAESVHEPVSWDYADRIVHITPVVCRWTAGEPQPIGCDECRWVRPDELAKLPMPPANNEIVRRLLASP